MANISFNTMSRVINTINTNTSRFEGVRLRRVHHAVCDYSYFFKLVVNFLSIEAGKQYYNQLDEQKKAFGTKMLLKLQQVNKSTENITITVAGHKIELQHVDAFQIECKIDGIVQGKIKGSLKGLKDRCIRRYAY